MLLPSVDCVITHRIDFYFFYFSVLYFAHRFCTSFHSFLQRIKISLLRVIILLASFSGCYRNLPVFLKKISSQYQQDLNLNINKDNRGNFWQELSSVLYVGLSLQMSLWKTFRNRQRSLLVAKWNSSEGKRLKCVKDSSSLTEETAV